MAVVCACIKGWTQHVSVLLQTAQLGKVTNPSPSDCHVRVPQQVREDHFLSLTGLLLWDYFSQSHRVDQDCISGWKENNPIPELCSLFPEHQWEDVRAQVQPGHWKIPSKHPGDVFRRFWMLAWGLGLVLWDIHLQELYAWASYVESVNNLLNVPLCTSLPCLVVICWDYSFSQGMITHF